MTDKHQALNAEAGCDESASSVGAQDSSSSSPAIAPSERIDLLVKQINDLYAPGVQSSTMFAVRNLLRQFGSGETAPAWQGDEVERRVRASICGCISSGGSLPCRVQYGPGSWCSACLGYELLDRLEAFRKTTPAWQPISTAPKDGTEVLLIGRFTTDLPLAVSRCIGRWFLTQSDGRGWWTVNALPFYPTLWQPLPSPPPSTP